MSLVSPSWNGCAARFISRRGQQANHGAVQAKAGRTRVETFAPAFNAVGAFPLQAGSRDAALLTSLAIGSYTVQVSGADGGTGEALIEIYEVQ